MMLWGIPVVEVDSLPVGTVILGPPLLDANFDLERYIQDRLIVVMQSDPEYRREEARFLYGTRAIKQPASRHTHSRRAKRRKADR